MKDLDNICLALNNDEEKRLFDHFPGNSTSFVI